MIYVLSDIHGRLDRFEKMLKMIDLHDDDTLYILGDVIDRGKDGIRILQKITEMPNIKMLLGNHEYMMMKALGFPYGGKSDIADEPQNRLLMLWYRNGGEVTHNGWDELTEDEQDKIRKFLLALPLNYDVEVNGQKYKLVHAAPTEEFEKGSYDDYLNEAEFSVWERSPMLPHLSSVEVEQPPRYDVMYIFGHTPTPMLQQKDESIRFVRDPLGFGHPKTPNSKIWHHHNRIGVDCGCAMGDIGQLGCLRLDDMKEYYVK